MQSEHHESTGSRFSTGMLVIVLLSLGAAAYFVFFQQIWEVSNIFLILLLLACPLMHLLMHGGHGEHLEDQ